MRMHLAGSACSNRPKRGTGPNGTNSLSMTVGTLLGYGLTDGANDLVKRGAGAKDLADAHRLDSRHILIWNDPASEDDDVGHTARPQRLHDARKERQVGTGVDRQPHRLDVLLERRLRNHLWGLADTGVDHLHAGVAERPRHHLRPSIVPVEARLGNQHPNRWLEGLL